MKKYNLIIYGVLISFIISITIFFIYYTSQDNTSLRDLKQISIKLNTFNDGLNPLVKDYTVDTIKTKDYLSECIKDLNILSNSISTLDTTPKNSSIKNKLTSSVTSTLNLYDKCLSALNNPENITDNSIINSINELKSECEANYSALKEDNINIKFTKDTDLFFENLIYYINTIIKINIDSNFKNTQKREFIYKLQSFSNKFDILNEDLFTAIDKVRDDKRDLNVIIDDIYLKEKSYDDIKYSLLAISIPEGSSDIYDSLMEYINSYKPYLESIKEAVIFEKSNKNLTSNELIKIYKDCKEKKEYSLECYNNFKNNLKN